MRALKIILLLAAALIGLAAGRYFFFVSDSTADVFPPPACSECFARAENFLLAGFSALLTVVSSKLVRSSDALAVLATVVAPAIYYPFVAIFRYGESLSYIIVPHSAMFWVPHLLGILCVLGLVHIVYDLGLRSFVTKNT